MGDYVAVTYGGKTLYAIVGDFGPRNVIGAGSSALAHGLGIDPGRIDGAPSGGVTYIIREGCRDSAPPTSAATIEKNGRACFGAQ